MVYEINEEQLQILINSFDKFITSLSFTVLCEFELVYDKKIRRLVLNIGISKSSFSDIKKMQELQQLNESLETFMGLKPEIKLYFSDCNK